MTADAPTALNWAASVADMARILRARGVDGATALAWAFAACRHIPFRLCADGPFIRAFRRADDVNPTSEQQSLGTW